MTSKISFEAKVKTALEYVDLFKGLDLELYYFYYGMVQKAKFWYCSPENGKKRSGMKRAHKMMDKYFRGCYRDMVITIDEDDNIVLVME